MSSVRKYKFNKGDFFVEDKKINNKLDDELKKYADKKISIEEVCHFSEDILAKIKKDFETNLDFSFTIYKNDNLYLDFFLKEKQKMAKKKNIKVPQKIIDTWKEYQNKRMMNFYKETNKSGFWQTKNKKLAKIENKLKNLVNKNFKIIKNTALNNKRTELRQMSAYLLNWHEDKKNVVRILLQLLNDPEHIVHNETARAIIGIIRKVTVPKKDIFNLLRHPNTSCRNKALGILLEMTKTNKLPKLNKKEVKMIKNGTKSHQPNNYKFAKLILKKIK